MAAGKQLILSFADTTAEHVVESYKKLEKISKKISGQSEVGAAGAVTMRVVLTVRACEQVQLFLTNGLQVTPDNFSRLPLNATVIVGGGAKGA